MAEFFAMGGYAFHVWTCWGLSTLLLGGLALARQRRLRRLAALVRTLEVQDGAGTERP